LVAITGDGGFLYTANELATAVRHRIPLTTVLFADGAFGNVRRIQRERYGGRHIGRRPHQPGLSSATSRASAPRRSARTIPPSCELALREALGRRDGPTVIIVPVGELPSPWEFIFAGRARG